MGVATVTVLFTDLVESTAAAQRAGPTAAEQARRQHFDALRRAVAAHKGTEVKSTGDGLMVVFPSPSDAVASAAAMQAAVRRAGRTPSSEARMRVGIALGEATEEDGDWYGIPVVRAARLCAVADAGQVLVDRFVGALADYAGAHFESHGELELKGIADPEPAFELVWEAMRPPMPLPPTLASTPGASFVGRSVELADLRKAWERVTDNDVTALVLLAGEPGAGKTSLASELARGLHADSGGLVMFGRCDDGPGLAYQPFAQALGHYVDHADREVLAAHVQSHGGEVARLAPQLSARVPDLPPATVGDPAGEQWRLFNATHGLLMSAGHSTPVLLVIDDLHWADPPTLQLLTYLLKADTPARAMIVATYRDTELGRTHPLADALAELRRLPGVERVDVGGLDPDETASLMEAIAGHELGDDGRSLAEALHARTEGNPFFAIEVLRHLAESGAIVLEEGRWRSSTDIGSTSLPEGVKEVVGRRLRRLSDDANRALGVAAVAGLEFDVAVVAHVLDVDVVETLDALGEAVRAGVVEEGDRPNRFAFTHALIRGTVQDEAGASRRVHLHGRIAEAIEALHADDLEPWLADLAFHYAEAAYPGRTAPAVDFALRAAAQARRSAAIDTAIEQLERGLAAARVADSPDAVEVATLLVTLAETTAVDSPVRARAYATEASEVADAAGLTTLVAGAAASMWSVFNTTNAGAVGGDRWLLDLCKRALVHERDLAPEVRSLLVAMRALMQGWTGDDVDVARVDAALDEANTTDDSRAVVLCALASWLVNVRGGRADWPRYLSAVDAAMELTDDEHLRGMTAVFTSWGASLMGDRARFDRAYVEIEHSYTMLHSRRMRTWADWMRAETALRQGEWEEAAEATTSARSVVVDPAIGDALFGAHMGLSMMHQGRAADVVSVLDHEGPDVFSAGRLAFQALARALAGDHHGASIDLATLLDRGGADTDPSGIAVLGAAPWAAAVAGDRRAGAAFEELLRPYRGVMAAGGVVEMGAVDRLLGGLATIDGRFDEADELFENALALEETYGAPVFATHTRYWWARCLLERGSNGDRERAKTLSAECIATADRLGMAQVAREARELAGS